VQYLFSNEYSPSRVDEIVAYLAGPRLWIPQAQYPDYDDWLQKVHRELKSEQKRALIAFAQGIVCGAIIYQRHKSRQDILELKNITVRPEEQGRLIASFLMRNTEIEGARDFPGVTSAVCDAKRDNVAIGAFLRRNRYQPVGTADLYGLGGGADVLFRKPLVGGRVTL
jgi:ribosomal protein S18 acetylase RimI-like enzyme